MHYFLLILSFLMVTACSSGDDSSDNDFPSHTIDTNNATDEEVNRTGTIYDLKIIGNNNIVTIGSNNRIRRFEIKGSDNKVIFEGPMEPFQDPSNKDLEGSTVYGADNLVCVPTGDTFVFDIDNDPGICILTNGTLDCDPARSSNKVEEITSVNCTPQPP